MKPSQVARRRASHLCLFGEAKSGKSTMVATLIKSGFKLHWVSMDNGHEVIFKLLNDGVSSEQLDNLLNLIIIPDTKENPIAGKTCQRLLSGKPANICDLHGMVDCSVCSRNKQSFTIVDPTNFRPNEILVLDHISQLADSIMTVVMSKEKDEEEKPTFNHYFAQGAVLSRILTNMQQARYNVICISQALEAEQEDGKKKLFPLVGTRNFSSTVGKYFDHIVYVEVSSGSHKAGSKTTYKANTMTGSRGDIDIKDTMDLSMFFDGRIPPPEEHAEEAAQAILDQITTAHQLENEAVAAALTEPVKTMTGLQSSSTAAMLERLKGKRG